jgi:DNA-directed RNA polymerase sigma subunit (sigma70/sigma32)
VNKGKKDGRGPRRPQDLINIDPGAERQGGIRCTPKALHILELQTTGQRSHTPEGGAFATYTRTCKEAEAPGVLAAYMARIGCRGDLLSHTEEVELGRGGPIRRRWGPPALVENKLRLTVCVAKEYRGRGLPFEDLIQEGNIRLMHAEKF